jgi:hypothetical protein
MCPRGTPFDETGRIVFGTCVKRQVKKAQKCRTPVFTPHSARTTALRHLRGSTDVAAFIDHSFTLKDIRFRKIILALLSESC